MTKISVRRKFFVERMLKPITDGRVPVKCYIEFDKWKQEVEKAFEVCKADAIKYLDFEKAGISQKYQQMIDEGYVGIITFKRLRSLTALYMERDLLLITDINKKLPIFGNFFREQALMILGERVSRSGTNLFVLIDFIIEHKTGTYLFFGGLTRDGFFNGFTKIYNDEKPLIDPKFKVYDTISYLPLSVLHRIVSRENSLKDVKVSPISLYRISVFLNDKVSIGDIYSTLIREYSEQIRLLASIDEEGLSDTEIEDIVVLDETKEQYTKARMFESMGDTWLESRLGSLLFEKTFVELSVTDIEELFELCKVSHLSIEDLESFRGFSLIKQNDTTYRLSRRIIERLEDME